jgi:hypothetical protein
MPERHFPPPRSVEELDSCFVVKDANGQALACVYFENESGRRAAAYLLTRDEATAHRCQHRQAAGVAGAPKRSVNSRRASMSRRRLDPPATQQETSACQAAARQCRGLFSLI